MKTIELLDGSVNNAGVFTETYGVLSSLLWEHPDKAGHFIHTTLGYGGLKFKQGNTVIAITFADLFALATNYEPNLLPQLPDVTAAPDSGVHPQNVTLSCDVVGVAIRYTTNGLDPSELSTLYAGPVNIAAAATLKAKAFKANWRASNTATFIYT